MLGWQKKHRWLRHPQYVPIYLEKFDDLLYLNINLHMVWWLYSTSLRKWNWLPINWKHLLSKSLWRSSALWNCLILKCSVVESVHCGGHLLYISTKAFLPQGGCSLQPGYMCCVSGPICQLSWISLPYCTVGTDLSIQVELRWTFKVQLKFYFLGQYCGTINIQ